jgi:hypothetical protein
LAAKWEAAPAVAGVAVNQNCYLCNDVTIFTLSTRTIIKKCSAIFLLLVLAFGIAPKRTIHNLIATHLDGQAKPVRKSDSASSINRATFNCQCDNLVIESPFLPGLPVAIPSITPAAAPMNGHSDFTSAFIEAVFFGLRGPPHAC